MNIREYTSQDRVLLAVDCIIFGFDGQQLKALLIKRGFEPEKDKWSLMGGFVGQDESTDEAARRILHQLTGMRDIYMEQLYCFSDVSRDTAGRVVSVAYYSLINIEEYNEQLEQDHEARWFPLGVVPDLVFDHTKMMTLAKERLCKKVSNHPVGFELLPKKFTLPQLLMLYEAIFGSALDKRNFTRRILSMGFLKKLNEKNKESSRKGAFYYVFDKKTYSKLEHEGMKFL